MTVVRAIVWTILLLLGSTGCASVNLSAGFPEVATAVEERSATRIASRSLLTS